MQKFKSLVNLTWLKRFWTVATVNAVGNRRRFSTNRLQTEQLEPRIVLSAILLEIPGINGDATVAGATPREMELRSFQWGFFRTETGVRSSLSDPIKFTDLTFQRTTDSASNNLYAQAALQTLDAKPAKLRLVDNGANLLKLDLKLFSVGAFIPSY